MLTHVGILYSTFSTFHSGNRFLAGGSADTLDKSCHKPGQEAQLPNPMSISLGNPWMPKCTAQLHSLNLVNRMCLSKSDFDVQSVGYKSAQSPTNWESIHGKVPSILCWLSPSLSIALDDSCITQNAKSKIMDIRNLYESSCYKMSLKKQRICCQHNYNVFGAKAHAKRPEIWDVPDWFRCMCEFQVRQMMSPQNGYIYIYI